MKINEEDISKIETKRIYAMAILGAFSNSKEPIILSVDHKKQMEEFLKELVFIDIPRLIETIRFYQNGKLK